MELLIILAIVLLLFGSTKLPGLARSLGSSVSEFKKGTREADIEADALAKKDAEKSTPSVSRKIDDSAHRN